MSKSYELTYSPVVAVIIIEHGGDDGPSISYITHPVTSELGDALAELGISLEVAAARGMTEQ